MYNIEFYQTRRGDNVMVELLEELHRKSKSDKTARIEYNQIVLYIDLLSQNGTRLSQNITKHIEDGI